MKTSMFTCEQEMSFAKVSGYDFEDGNKYSRITDHGSRITVHGSRITVHGSL